MSNTNLSILYEDNHLIAVNKAPSQLVQGDKTGNTPLSELLKMYIKERDCKPGNVFMGVTHRLDRPVSGVVLFAKTDKALSRINKLIRDRQLQKTYWAIVGNMPDCTEGELCNYLVKNEKLNKSFISSRENPLAQEAKLKYKLISNSDRYYLLEIELITGRHHQIRAQLSGIGCPIKGDLKYGSKRSNADGSICLHARRLSFEHPVKHTIINIIAPPPNQTIWNNFL